MRVHQWQIGFQREEGDCYLLTDPKVPRIGLDLFVALYELVLKDPAAQGPPDPDTTTCWFCDHGEFN